MSIVWRVARGSLASAPTRASDPCGPRSAIRRSTSPALPASDEFAAESAVLEPRRSSICAALCTSTTLARPRQAASARTEVPSTLFSGASSIGEPSRASTCALSAAQLQGAAPRRATHARVASRRATHARVASRCATHARVAPRHATHARVAPRRRTGAPVADMEWTWFEAVLRKGPPSSPPQRREYDAPAVAAIHRRSKRTSWSGA